MTTNLRRNNKIASTCIVAKNKAIEQLTLPKAFIIKIEDSIPRRLYMHLLTQSLSKSNRSEISAWYSSNREHCVLFLQSLCDSFKLRENTFFSALSYADRLMRNSEKLSKKDYDLKIIACLLLASKYVENEAFDLDLNDFTSLEKDCLYNIKDIKKYEFRCLRDLDYELSEPTVYDLLISQIACGILYKDELQDKNDVNAFVNYAKNILIQSTRFHLFLLYKPETIALSVIQYCRLNFKFQPQRISQIKAKLQFDDKEFDACCDYLNSIRRDIHRKKSIKVPLNSQLKKSTKTVSKPIQPNKRLTVKNFSNLNAQPKCIDSSCSTNPDSTSSLVQVHVLPSQKKTGKNRSSTVIFRGSFAKMSSTYNATAFLPNIKDY